MQWLRSDPPEMEVSILDRPVALFRSRATRPRRRPSRRSPLTWKQLRPDRFGPPCGGATAAAGASRTAIRATLSTQWRFRRCADAVFGARLLSVSTAAALKRHSCRVGIAGSQLEVPARVFIARIAEGLVRVDIDLAARKLACELLPYFREGTKAGGQLFVSLSANQYC